MSLVVSNQRPAVLDEGQWADYGGSRFLIAHTSNLKFQREINRLQAPFRKQIEKGTMDPEDSKKIVCKALAAHILKDWDKVVDTKGEPLSYNKDIGVIALTNDEGLREFVQDFSTDLANYREEEIADKGND